MNERTISIIKEYMQRLEKPNDNVKTSYFKQLSYSRWAVGEILRCVEKQKSIPPARVVEDFIFRMDQYSCVNHNSSFMFSVAHDIAEDILDSFLETK